MAGGARTGQAAFVGRGRELAVVQGALSAAEGGRGGLVALTGEPGIGKTRLAEEVLTYADGLSFRTAWGAAWPEGGAPSFWPWQDVLTQLGADGADGLFGGEDGAAQRFTRFRAVTAELKRLAGDRPLLVVLDDAHAMDDAAALLARFAVRSLRTAGVLFLLTCRDDPPDAVSALLGEALRLPLRGLDEDEVAALLEADAAGVPVDAAALVELTGGNPLLLREALAAGRPGAATPLTNVRPLLLRRLNAFPPDSRGVLAAAAVLGASATDDLVAGVAGVTTEEVRRVRDVARTVGFLRRGAGATFVFAHGLLREALLDEFGPEAVARLHERAARALGSAAGAPADLAVRVAQHLITAARHDAAPVEDALAAARQAAAAARRRDAHEAAAQVLRDALDLLPDAGRPAALLLELAKAELAGGRLRTSRAAFLLALDGRDADPVTVAEAALGLGGIWVFEHREVAAREAFHETLRRAIGGLGEQRPDLQARLRARLAAECVYLGTATPNDVRVEVDALRRLGDLEGQAETLSLLHHVLLGPGDAAEREAVVAELSALAVRTGETVPALMAALWQTIDLFLVGDLGAEGSLAALRQRADALRVDAVLYIVELIEVTLAVRAGRLDEAEQRAQACFVRGAEVGDADAVAYYGAQLLGIRWLQGRPAEVLPMAREIAASPTLVPAHRVYPAAVAALAAAVGGPAREEAWRHLDALTAAGIGKIPPSSNWLLTIFCAVEAADLLGDATAATAAYDALAPHARLPVLASLAVMCFGSAQRALGLAARTAGRLDLAVAHLEAAVEENRRLGNRPLLAISRADLANTLRRRGRGDDVARAAGLLESAESALRGMGLAARADACAADSRPDSTPAVLRFEAGSWELRCGEHRLVLPDGLGMRYLARLLAAPGREIGADELAGGGSDGLRQDVLDDDARRGYRRRVEQLRAELDAADAAGDAARAGRAQAELDALIATLAAATGLGGRARTFADGRERARTAVQKAIRRALGRIVEAAPELGERLSASVQTGLVCRYDPVAGLPAQWQVALPRE